MSTFPGVEVFWFRKHDFQNNNSKRNISDPLINLTLFSILALRIYYVLCSLSIPVIDCESQKSPRGLIMVLDLRSSWSGPRLSSAHAWVDKEQQQRGEEWLKVSEVPKFRLTAFCSMEKEFVFVTIMNVWVQNIQYFGRRTWILSVETVGQSLLNISAADS